MRKANTRADKALPGRLLPALGKAAPASPSSLEAGSPAVVKDRGGRAVSAESLRAESITASESSGEGTGPRSLSLPSPNYIKCCKKTTRLSLRACL